MYAVPRLTHTLPMPDQVQGVTQLLNRLYILHASDSDQVDEYTTEDQYMRVRCISVPGLKTSGICDIASCEQNKCLYLSNMSNRYIHVVVPNSKSSKFSKWTLSEIPWGLSVTETGNLLVTCIQSSKLLEFNSGGKCIRTIILDSEIHRPLHSTQLASGSFVLCCTGTTNNLHTVCIVSPEGMVEQSYSGEVGGHFNLLSSPTHVAVDKDEFVYVADRDNHRIVLLSPSLQFVGLVLPNELDRPTNHVYISQATGQLYASSLMFDPLQRRSVVSVVQL